MNVRYECARRISLRSLNDNIERMHMKTTRLPRTRPRIPRNDEFHPCTVLVPIDFSTLSMTALKKGRQLAQQFGSKLHIIHAVEPVVRDVECILVPPEL